MEEKKNITAEDVLALVEYIAKNLVDDPDAVKVEIKPYTSDSVNADVQETEAESKFDNTAIETTDENVVTIALTVAKDDTGKVIGKQGRIAKAIRTVVRAATVKGDTKYRVDIM